MSRVYLYWEGPFTDLNGVVFGYSMGIYMFVDNDRNHDNKFIPRKVLYIGMTYFQNFREEISAKLRGDIGEWMRKNRFDVTVKIAHVEPIDQVRISEALVKDIEALLIIIHRPSGNIQSAQAYRGRDLTVFNKGQYRPLQGVVSTKELE